MAKHDTLPTISRSRKSFVRSLSLHEAPFVGAGIIDAGAHVKMGDEPVAPNDGVASLVGSEAAFAVINEASGRPACCACCACLGAESSENWGTERRGFTFLPGAATQQTSQRPPDAGNPALCLRCGLRLQTLEASKIVVSQVARRLC